MVTEKDQKTWLASMPYWKAGGLGSGWEGSTILGRGAFGVAGLWEYKGTDPGQPLRYVVVKQSLKESSSLRREAKILSILDPVRCPYIVRMYGRLFEEDRLNMPSRGTGNQKKGGMSRIYLEYCNMGDLKGFVSRLRQR
jgi:hypothetical protein